MSGNSVSAHGDARRRELRIALLRAQGIEIETSPTEPVRSPLLASTRVLSYAQQRLWFFEQANGGAYQHMLPLALRMRGRLSLVALTQAFARILERHEVLRTVVQLENGELVGVIQPPGNVPLCFVDLTELPSSRRESVATRLVEDEPRHLFDLRASPYLRATVLRLSAQEHVLLITMHHLVGDGWSQGLLLRELSAFYSARIRDTAPSVPTLALQYGDYAASQRELLHDERFVRRLAYWTEHLADARTEIRLPVDRFGDMGPSRSASVVTLEVPVPLITAIHALGCEQRVTVFALVLASFAITLRGWSGEDDVILGVPVTNRPSRLLEALIGLFVNMLPLRVKLTPSMTFRAVLQQVRDALLGGLAHQDLPFDRLVEELRPVRTPGRPPLVQIVFNGQNVGSEPLTFADLEIQVLRCVPSSMPFELTATVWEISGQLHIGIAYSTDLFERQTIERWVQHWRTVLERAVGNPDLSCRALIALSPEDRDISIDLWSRTKTAPVPDTTVAALFHRQVADRPDAVALIDGNCFITYRTLYNKASAIAAKLQSLDVGPECRVGVCLERSATAITAIVGVVLSGAAYVPVSPDDPPERKRSLLQSAGLTALITDAQRWDECAQLNVPLISPLVNDDAVARPAQLDADSLMYIMYTSGSSGEPKGVAVTHRGVVRLVHGATYVDLSPAEVILQYAPLAFDASTFEIWGALLNGAQLVVMPPGLAPLSVLRSVLEHAQVTTLWLPAGLFHLYVDEAGDEWAAVRQLVAGGDVVNPAAVRRVLRASRPPTVINGYGPTECTTFAVTARLTSGCELPLDVPLGRPIGHTSVYVLNAHGEALFPGSVGELYIGGAGVARGYWNRPDLTAAQFVPDPFASTPGARLYRTGDRARWRSDGHLQFLGRMDGEAKIRGYRVSPADIADVLRREPNIQDAAIVVRGASAESKVLVAYVVPRTSDVTSESLKARLPSILPPYAVPAHIVLCSRLPLTANGKLDRHALPNIEIPTQSNAVPPRTDEEQVIARAWCAALNCDHIDVHTNVFDAGAHSLALIKVHSTLENALRRPLAINHLFQYPTVASLARFVTAESTEESAAEIGRLRAAARTDAARRRRAASTALSEENVSTER